MARHPGAENIRPDTCLDWNKTHNLTCSLPLGHEGRHQAYASHEIATGRLLATWPQEVHIVSGL